MYQPYTYRISWTNQNKHYYGVRYSKDIEGVLAEEDIWVNYFTSSKIVHEFTDKFGDPDVIEIRKTFDDANSARVWEDKVLRRLKVLANSKWLNDNYGLSENWSMKGKRHSPETIAKMSSAKKGKRLSSDHKRKISSTLKGKKKDPEHIRKVAEALIGRKASEASKKKMSEWIRTDETKKKISDALTGKKVPKEDVEKRRTGMQQYWADVKSGKRERSVIKHSPESKERRSEMVKQYWADVKSGENTKVTFVIYKSEPFPNDNVRTCVEEVNDSNEAELMLQFYQTRFGDEYNFTIEKIEE